MSGSLYHPDWFRLEKLRPKLHASVEIHRHVYRGTPWYILRSKTAEQPVRLSPAGYALVSRFDGDQSLGELWSRTLDALGDDAPNQNETASLLRNLFNAGLVNVQKNSNVEELFDLAQEKREKEALGRYGNPLFLRFSLFNPDRLAGTLERGTRWLFTRQCLAVWLVVVIGGLVSAGYQADALGQALTNDALKPDNLLILWAVFPLLKLLHEAAHAIAVRHWGGHVRDSGIALLLLLPIPYVDASDSASFANKHHRISVAAIGIMVEAGLAAIAMLVWSIVEPGLISSIALNVALIGGISSVLFNGNPLLKFDAYYVLSDAIEIPSLASRSSRYLLYLLQKNLFGLSPRNPVTATGESAWLLGYGVSAVAYRLFLSVTICLFIVDQYFFFGVLLACWALFAQIVKPVGKGLWWLLRNEALSGHRLRAQVAIAVPLGLAATMSVALPLPYGETIRGVVWPVEDAILRPEVDCIVEEVLVADGGRVKTDTPILTCASQDGQKQLDTLVAEHDALQAERHGLSDRTERRIKQSEIETTRVLIEHAEERLRKYTVRASAPGRLYLPDGDNLRGRYFRQGERVGYLLNPANLSVRTMLPQHQAHLLDARLRGVSVRRVARPDEIFSSRVQNRTPSASSHAVSSALTVPGGGDLPVQGADSAREGLLNPAFAVDVTLPNELQEARAGEAIMIRFDLGSATLLQRLAHELRLLFLSRLDS